MDGIFWLRTELEEAAKDTAQEQRKQAGKLHHQKESPMAPTQYIIKQVISHQMLQWNKCLTGYNENNKIYLYKSSPFKYVCIVTNELDIRIRHFLSLHFFVFLKKPCPWCLFHKHGINLQSVHTRDLKWMFWWCRNLFIRWLMQKIKPPC